MKVLIICSHSESLILFRIDLIKKLHFLNHEIHAAAPALCDDHKTTEFLHSLEVKTHSLFIRRTGLNPFHDFITFLNLKDLTRKIRPTHVLAYTVKPVIYGMFAAKLTRVPTRVALITGLGFGFVEKSEGLRRFVQVLLRLLYKMALSMAEHAQSIAKYKTALLLKITFLEGCARAKFFKQHPPKRVWVFSKRLSLLKDGQSYNGGMMCLAWFVWETGSTTPPQIGWL